ncbi:MAG: hypothetical protein QOG82_2935 [Actinomycetota bacterium]|nr:hypothetical protein [Actinomycetota bacterium]
MVVLVSFLLVLAAAVTLVVGLLQSGLTLIYLSIGCSVVAGLVLAVAVLRGRPEPKAAPYAAPPRPVSTPTPTPVPTYSRFESEPEPADEPWKVDTTPPPAARRFGRPAPVAIEEDEEPSPIAGYARRAAGAGASTAPMAIRDEMPEALPPRGDFPIADFDTLRAPELLRRVDELADVASLEEVREAEAAGKNRVSILSRIDARLETLREPGWDIDEAAWEGDEPEAAVAADDLDAGDDFDDDGGAAGDFPIDNYDNLRVGQILPQLRGLDDAQLADVRAYEAAGKSRSGILDRIDSLSSGGTPTAAAAAPAAAAPAAGGGRSSIAAAVAAAKAKQAEKG